MSEIPIFTYFEIITVMSNDFEKVFMASILPSKQGTCIHQFSMC